MTTANPSSNCWWTETGHLCCITGDTPWPKCVAGGVLAPGSGGAARRAVRRAVLASNPLLGNPQSIAKSAIGNVRTHRSGVLTTRGGVPQKGGLSEWCGLNGTEYGLCRSCYVNGKHTMCCVGFPDCDNDGNCFTPVDCFPIPPGGGSGAGSCGTPGNPPCPPEAQPPIAKVPRQSLTRNPAMRSGGGGGFGGGGFRSANPVPADALPVSSSPALPPPGGGPFVVAPSGAYPGAFAWRYSGGHATPVTITAIFNDTAGLWARVTANIASLDGGFSEALAPFSQGSSVRTSSGAPARSANPSPCHIDLAALRIHCPGSPLHGVEVTDIEAVDGSTGVEGDVVVASYVDPSTGVETIGAFVVMADQGVPWWEHEGHCCESCALGEGCSDCEAA